MPEGEVTKTQMGTTYIEQADGSKVIPGSRRPDGTMRKAVRVKQGYVPSEENKYESLGTKMMAKANSGYPPGFAPPEETAAKPRVPGLPDDYVEQTAKKAAKKKNKAAKKEEAPAAPAEPEPKKEAPKEAAAPAAEPEKRLKNVKKKLAEIEALEAKPKASLSADQLKKVGTKAEFLAEAKYLEKVLAGQARGMKPDEAKEAAMKATQKKGPAAAPVIPAAKQPGSPELQPAVPAAGAYPPAPKAKAEGKKKAAAPAPEPAKAAAPADATDAAKRVRNVKKKLAEIERLEQSKTALSDDQKAKVARKKDFEVELRMLEKQLK